MQHEQGRFGVSATEHTFDMRHDSCYHGCCSTVYVVCSCGWERILNGSLGSRDEQTERAQLAHRLDVLEGKA